MPQYFYHLKFELYPHPEPVPSSANSKTLKQNRSKARDDDVAANLRRKIWLPGESANIFDSSSWPAHKPVVPLTSARAIGSVETGTGTSPYFRSASQAANIFVTAGGGGGGGVIDCGPSRAAARREDDAGGGLIQAVTSTTDTGFPPPSPGNIQGSLEGARRDWRFERVRVESWDSQRTTPDKEGEGIMERPGHKRGESSAAISSLGEVGNESTRSGMNAGLTAGGGGRVTKARFEEGKNTEVGWGIVHLFRDGEESVGLGRSSVEVYNSMARADAGEDEYKQEGEVGERGEDYTTLCIPAVPSYLTPSDFLGFVGEKTREDVSHFRMVMTGRMNRYLVLMKFRDGEVAKKWKADWDGKVFNTMEPETCHVTFIKSITFQTPSTTSPSSDQPSTSFPALAYDPFTPSSTHLKPFPPPTPSLIELPTCPVCLERMDDTTGLLTILCQHVFHCSCLQKWRGSGCPVCRHTNTSTSSLSPYSSEPPFGSGEASLCSVCDTTDDLWICLICGNVGCGRYKGGHAKEHWKENAHCFALEIETQHVWDYAGDMWVHRLIRDKGNGKVVELPNSSSRDEGRMEMDMVPREKLERIGIEYTHLLTSQLESQRVYFEELVGKAVAKAENAASSTVVATASAEEALSKLRLLEVDNRKLKEEVVAGLEKDLAREKRKAEKSSEVARGFGKSLMEEKKVSEGLLERIEHVNSSMMKMSGELTALKEECEDLREQNRDLLFSLSAGEKIKELEGQEGGLEAGEAEGGSLVLPPEKKKGRRKK